MKLKYRRNRARKDRFTLALPIMMTVAVMLVGCASAGPRQLSSTSVPLGARVTPPAGFLDFCARRPEECDLKLAARTSADGAQADPRQVIYRKYLWAVAFRLDAQPAPHVETASTDIEATGKIAPIVGAPEDAAQLQRVSPVSPPSEPGAVTPPQTSAPNADGRDDPDDVRDVETAPAVVHLTSATLMQLNLVNRLVNGLIRQTPDIQAYGVADYWTEPLEGAGPRMGDCEDYVLEKRRALIARGLPSSAMSIAVVTTHWGETHAVLLVDTDKGEMVLDSLSSWILGWQDAPYQWVERQVPGAPMVWVASDGGAKAVAPADKAAAPSIIAAGEGPQPAAG